jgi:hypothetical protein
MSLMNISNFLERISSVVNLFSGGWEDDRNSQTFIGLSVIYSQSPVGFPFCKDILN